MKEAASVFGKQHGVDVIHRGASPKMDQDGEVPRGYGSEVMMSSFIASMPEIDPATVKPLYLRAAPILARPRQLTGAKRVRTRL
jgi:accessory colonization factor AcfC